MPWNSEMKTKFEHASDAHMAGFADGYRALEQREFEGFNKHYERSYLGGAYERKEQIREKTNKQDYRAT